MDCWQQEAIWLSKETTFIRTIRFAILALITACNIKKC
jgi:hypothetical protein